MSSDDSSGNEATFMYLQEAIAIVLDVGPGMNQAAPGESTDLETSLIAVRMILQRKVSWLLDSAETHPHLILCTVLHG